MTAMNPRLDTYFLHSLYEQFFGFQSFLKVTTPVSFFNSKGTVSQILGPKYKILSLPWKTDLKFGIAESEFIVKLQTHIFYCKFLGLYINSSEGVFGGVCFQ